MNIKTIAWWGPAPWGAGIVQVAARAGYQVVMRDIEDAFVSRGLAIITKALKLVRAGHLGRKTGRGFYQYS